MSQLSTRPIPIPLRQRWQEVRLRLVPALVFVAAVATVSMLWRNHVAGPVIIGQAEPILANVSCYKPGVLAELSVSRFQRVKAGEPVGQVMITDPKILASSLAVIQSEIEMLRVNLKPILVQQHNAMDYDQLRLDWMKQRAQLASSQVNLQLARTEFHRMDELYKDQIVSARVFDQAKAAQDRLEGEVRELSRLVTEGEAHLKSLQLTNTPDPSKVSADPLLAAIGVQETKLKLTEAELSPIPLRAPMDGIVSTIYHRAGEAVNAGQPIVAIATFNAVRIVGYLRPPILEEPKVGAQVIVRTRGLRREVGPARVLEVGSQMESVPATLLGPVKFANVELGLPVDISLPTNVKIRPGELVDIYLPGKSD